MHGYAVRKLVSTGWPSLLSNHSNEASHIWQTILIFNFIYLMNILRPLPAKLEHYYLFDPCRAKNLTLTFSSITTKRYVVDRSNYTFSESPGWIVITRGICWYDFWQHWSNFEFDPCTNYLVTPLPGFLYRMWPGSNMNYWPLVPYQHTKIIKPFVSFQLSKSC